MVFSYPQLLKARLIGQLRTKTRVADKLEFIKDDDRRALRLPQHILDAINYTYFPVLSTLFKAKQEKERKHLGDGII
jgi:hypothetical protein